MKEEVSHWKQPCQKNNFLKYKVWSFYVCFFPRLKTTINFFDIKRILLWQPSNKACLQFYARTTDKRWLNPWFLAAQIQIPVPNKYLGYGQRVIIRESKTDCYSKRPTLFGLRCIFCHNFWTNYDLDLFSTSKWPSDLQFCERYKGRCRKND